MNKSTRSAHCRRRVFSTSNLVLRISASRPIDLAVEMQEKRSTRSVNKLVRAMIPIAIPAVSILSVLNDGRG